MNIEELTKLLRLFINDGESIDDAAQRISDAIENGSPEVQQFKSVPFPTAAARHTLVTQLKEMPSTERISLIANAMRT